MNPKRQVQAGYDHIAESYLASKDPDDPVLRDAVDRASTGLPAGARVLDLGCGAGVPVTRWLAERFTVVGVDLAARQLALARRHVPAARLIQADMATLAFPDATFAAVVAFYAIIHVPRAEQPALLARIYRWLQPGGAFLAPWPRTTWEGTEPDWQGWGAPMWWSHYDAPTNLAMLQAAGFAIPWAESRTSHGETWLWVLARKPSAEC